MSKINEFWRNIRHFSPHENWGDPSRINPLLLIILDGLRELVGKPFVIHCAYEHKGHAPNSYHYTGDAVDFHIKWGAPFETHVRLVQAYLGEIDVIINDGTAINFITTADKICGLGIYPTWNHPGFHLDVRQYPARWGRIFNEYVSFEEALRYAKGKAIVGSPG